MTLVDVIAEQTGTEGEFLCYICRFWAGGVSCVKNHFISTEGCNTSNCSSFQQERRREGAAR